MFASFVREGFALLLLGLLLLSVGVNGVVVLF